MIPNIYLQEQLVRDLLRRGQRQSEKERILASLPRHGRLRHLVGRASLLLRSGPANSSECSVIDRVVTPGRQWACLSGVNVNMHQPIQAEEECNMATLVEPDAALRDQLAQWSFSAEEIVALFWLRQSYQTGGSDRVELLRHWGFLKQLVITGRLEV